MLELMLEALNKFVATDSSAYSKRQNWKAMCSNLPNANIEEYKAHVLKHCLMLEQHVDTGQRNPGRPTQREDLWLRLDREAIWLLYYIVGGQNRDTKEFFERYD